MDRTAPVGVAAATAVCSTWPPTSVPSSSLSSSSSIFSVDAPSSQSSSSSTLGGALDVVWEHNSEQHADNATQCSMPGTMGVPGVVVPAALRQNPRRTFAPLPPDSSGEGARLPPALMRQCERKETFVESLVDTSAQIVEAIWPMSAAPMKTDLLTGTRGVLPLRTFIEETLKRSRTSYSTLQVALYYLILVKDWISKQPGESLMCRAMLCGRRMFLCALILASKYLQDRNFSARAWSRISGLKVQEINSNEMAFLTAVDWKLHVPPHIFKKWADLVLKFTSPRAMQLPNRWRTIIALLTPSLDRVEFEFPSAGRIDPATRQLPPLPVTNGMSSLGQAQTICLPRPPLDQWQLRRPSLAWSSTSSPDSMVSDNTRASRSSSISSISLVENASVDAMTSLPLRCRKRGRPPTTEPTMNPGARSLLNNQTEGEGVSSSFMIPAPKDTAKGVQYPSSYSNSPRLPLPTGSGNKRACCDDEAKLRAFADRFSAGNTT